MDTYLNLQAERLPLKLIDEPCGHISAMAKANLGHQMRYSARVLEQELVADGSPHILQLKTRGDDYVPERWRLYANGTLIASGSGDYARQCFEKDPRAFLSIMREAIEASSEPLTGEQFRLLAMARNIATVECTER